MRTTRPTTTRPTTTRPSTLSVGRAPAQIRRYCVGGCGHSEMLSPSQDGLVCRECSTR